MSVDGERDMVIGEASFPGAEPLPGGGVLVRPMYGPWPADSYWTPFDDEGYLRSDLDGWHRVGAMSECDPPDQVKPV